MKEELDIKVNIPKNIPNTKEAIPSSCSGENLAIKYFLKI